ncbi:putative Acylpyruvase FAHD1, mitochondrial [Cardiosporidium cionae]|uniref:Acylpyruvase FAHD1, mitochondrial n=1 Tax=Cardiosporidium cionae TaxID=476202 RepID=A0ABQ7JEI1_9APIC|nr:putative Acylpyruvase FAHD1, mitochondrial [Cardiosporidium cionae]|eukprot:KAF8822378.1 putative Acylpyruvase FAHD1, mitochondrial [Cardiosporidium cionae]
MGGNVAMLFSSSGIISFLSQDMVLLPDRKTYYFLTIHRWKKFSHAGTVILSATPDGVGYLRNPPVYLQKGGIVSVTIESIGSLSNQIDTLYGP